MLRGNKLIFKRPSVPKIWSRWSVLGSTSVNVISQLSPLITLSLGTALEQGPLTFRRNLRKPGFTAQAFCNGLPVDLREVSRSDMANGAARTFSHTRGRDSVARANSRSELVAACRAPSTLETTERLPRGLCHSVSPPAVGDGSSTPSASRVRQLLMLFTKSRFRSFGQSGKVWAVFLWLRS